MITENPFELARPPWGRLQLVRDRRGILILDRRQIHLDALTKPVRGKVAYVAGLDARSLAMLCELVIAPRMEFFDMRMASIVPLGSCRHLRHLAIRWNTRLTSLAPLAGLPLQTLILDDTARLHDLAPLKELPQLRYFEFSGGLNRSNVAKSLAPLADLKRLRHVRLLNLRVRSGGLEPLAQCRSLRELEVSNQFDIEDYARLAAKLPRVKCAMFKPWVRRRYPEPGEDDLMLVGVRDAFVHSRRDRERVRRHEQRFSALKRSFEAND
jgi:hypothetical protein